MTSQYISTIFHTIHRNVYHCDTPKAVIIPLIIFKETEQTDFLTKVMIPGRDANKNYLEAIHSPDRPKQ